MANTNANGRVVAPAVLQPQLSTDVVGFNLENNQASALGQQYITFQETFLPGEVTTGTHLVAIVGGQKIPVQMDVKTTNADGSVRSALLTFEQPSISAHSSLSFMLSTTGTAFTTGPLSLASLNGSNYDLKSFHRAARRQHRCTGCGDATGAGLERGHGFLLANRTIGNAGTR